MPYDVVAYEADDLAMALSESEEGLFHRMMRRSWMNGSIPADLTLLASVCRTHPSRLKKAWIKIAPLWQAHPTLPGRLINSKQERERAWVEQKTNSAKHSAEERWKQQKEKEIADANALRTQSERNASPSPPRPLPVPESNTENNSSPIVSPPTEKLGGHHDAAGEHFRSRCLELTGAPYVFARQDFVQLATLRKGFGISSGADPPGWEDAVTNYFASPLGQISLADLANPKRYAIFKNSALDEFKKPINHRGNGNGRQPKTKSELNREASERILARFDQQDREREQRDDHGGDADRVHGAVVAPDS